MLAMVPEQQFYAASISAFFNIKLEERDCIFHASLEGSAHKAKGNCIMSTKIIWLSEKRLIGMGWYVITYRKIRDEASELLQLCL